MFLGRVMRITGAIVEVDGLGMLLEGTTPSDKRQLLRIAKNPPTEPELKVEPAKQVLVDDAAQIFISDKSIYYLEPEERWPFNGSLLYLPTGVDDTEPKALGVKANRIVGEWDGWVYVLRLRDEINGVGHSAKVVAAWRTSQYTLGGIYGWRFQYDLIRVRQDGTSETIGVFPRSVDAYFDGYVYGSLTDRTAGTVSVFRAPVPNGKHQVLYQRAWGIGRGGVQDHIGEVRVDKDGVFFYDARPGVLRRVDHDGGNSEEVVRDLAFGITMDLMDDYVFVHQRPRLKKGGTITWRNDSDALFGKGQSGCGEIWSSTRKGAFQYVAGRRSIPDQWYGDLWGFAFEYLPGGVVDARRFKLKPGHTLIGAAVDDECLYYTRNDYYNTWLYGMRRPATR